MSEELPTLPIRDPAGHKGLFGTVCVIGGQAALPRVMIGGPAFTAEAALRTGSGLAVLAMPTPIMASGLVIAPGATGLALPVDRDRALLPSDVATLLDAHLSEFDCLAIGPGWGDGLPQQQILIRLLAQGHLPMVVDADALNALARMAALQADFTAAAVLTPHPGEYRRLADSVGIEADPVDPDTRPDAAAQLAARLGCVVVLKGAGTVVSNGVDTFINETGNVALATAGTGDVLTGVIASLVGQHFRPNLGTGATQITAPQQGGLGLLDCARLGVHIHGLAADLWAEQHGHTGMTAVDLLAMIPAAIHKLGTRGASA